MTTYQIKQSYITADYFTVEADSPEQARDLFNKEGGNWLCNQDEGDEGHQIEEVTLYEQYSTITHLPTSPTRTQTNNTPHTEVKYSQ